MAAEAPQQPDAAQLEKQLNEINAELEKAHLEHKETSLDKSTCPTLPTAHCVGATLVIG